MTSKSLGLLAALCLLVPANASAEIKGEGTAICASIEVLECVPNAGCERVGAREANIPRFLRIDFANGLVSRTRPDGTSLSSKIESSKSLEHRIILQGAEEGAEGVRDGIGWSLAIEQANGEMVLTGSGHDVGFVIFGACEAL